MFDRIKGKRFERRVVDTIERELIALLGKERGEASVGLFAHAISKAQEFDDMPRDLMAQLRKTGLNIDEAAVAYLDASVTACKRTRKRAGRLSAELEAIISDMESGIDHMFLAKPSARILPRNGKVGDSLSEFAER